MPENDLKTAEADLKELVDGPLLEYIKSARPELLNFFETSLQEGHPFALPIRAAYVAGWMREKK